MPKNTRSKKQKKVVAKTLSPAPKPALREEEKEFKVQWGAIEELGKTMDEQHINELTDHVFSSALSKLGWTRNEQGHLEKIGIEKAA